MWTRDAAHCRWCGTALPWGRAGSVDHIIPRRLADPAWADEPDNLACLCARHHWQKTHEIEPALYRGDPWPWLRWLDVLRLTGPVPAPSWTDDALRRLRGWWATAKKAESA